MTSTSSILQYIDALIRSGSHSAAQKELLTILADPLPREFLPEAASHCRRLSIPELGLNLLRPWVRPSEKEYVESTDAERAEYASCLIRAGVISEAHRLLDEVSVAKYPKALIIRAFGFIGHWRHEESARVLREYLKLDSTSYLALIARVNLVQSLLFLERGDELESLLEVLRHDTLKTNNAYLFSNALEFSALHEIHKRNFDKAAEFVRIAKSQLLDSKVIDTLLLKIVEAEIHLASGKKKKFWLEESLNLKAEAIKRRHWESIRQCDFLFAKYSGDQATALRLYFGTPFKSYREKIKKSIGFNLPESHHFTIEGKSTTEQKFDLDLRSGSTRSDFSFKPSQTCFRILRSLADDFYRPKRLVDIFQDVFGDEFYFKKSSSDRVHQNLKRLRQILRENLSSLQVIETDGIYRLQSQKEFVILKSVANKPSTNLDNAVLTFFHKWKIKEPHSVKEICTITNMSARQVQRYCAHGTNKGWIKKIGNGPSTKYQSTGKN